MKKKKRLADLMEEDLMETIQKRIDELNAELKMLDEQCGKFFTPYPITASRLRCKQDLRELEDEQRRLRREQERRGREEQERRGREEQERREHEAREIYLSVQRTGMTFSGANGSMVYGILRAVYWFSLTPNLTRASIGRTIRPPFCAL